MRTLIFTDVNAAPSARLIDATLRLAKTRGDIEVVGIVTSRPRRFRRNRVRAAQKVFRRLLVSLTNHQVPWRTVLAPTVDLGRLARRHGVRVLVPESHDPNDERFIDLLSREIRPEIALSYDCLTIFRKPLLETFAQAVNYHAGKLPDYRGVMATSFSILTGETDSGFTFHRMTERVDAGPILVEGTVPIAGGTSEDVGRRKLDAAIEALPEVLDKVAANDPGRPPSGRGQRFDTRDWMALLRVDDLESVTAEQLARRVRAFGIVHLKIEGREYAVTRLRRAAGGESLAFRTADGKVLAPDRFQGLPWMLHRFERSWFAG